MPSSVIAHMHYNAGSLTLRVVFVSGAVYEYRKVPPTVFDAMKASRSKGTYLNQEIKPNYSYKKVKQ